MIKYSNQDIDWSSLVYCNRFKFKFAYLKLSLNKAKFPQLKGKYVETEYYTVLYSIIQIIGRLTRFNPEDNG